MVDAYTGEIRMFAGNYVPEYWMPCDGRLLNISQYEPLFSLIGTAYGGNGRTNFALPDLRGRAPVGQGSGAGLTSRVIGNSLGAENVALDMMAIPPHGHDINVIDAPADQLIPGPTVNLAATAPPVSFYLKKLQDPEKFGYLADETIGNACGIPPSPLANSHENMMPSFVLTYIICPDGLYPTRD